MVAYGVKSLSYGGNLLGERIANQRGYEDAVFCTSDGYLLEGTTSSLVWLREDTLYTTAHELGVLPGTTQETLFSLAKTLNLGTAMGRLRTVELGLIDGAWLMSAMRLATAIDSIDGSQLPVDLPLTMRINEVLFGAMRVVT